MMLATTLVLRDIHRPPAPPWWPPAPGWWWLALVLLAVAAGLVFLRARRRERRRAIAVLFDSSVDAAPTPATQVAAMSELLRRAARQRDPAADRLHGEAWLAFLDSDDRQCGFTRGPGRLLLEGGYQRDADPRAVTALRELARARFLTWMAGK
ncbi:DUF4381 family protein [Lysobacter koreensis]|uniref:DUF4381 family protein n=1 Tax=Lysobacter koreensis TaxID=266122 RepID=A0ABW2YLC1_9GAMM